MQIIRKVHTDKVAILKVEPVQFIAGLFCVHHVFIDHESGAFGVARNTLADLTVTRITLSPVLRSRAYSRHMGIGRTVQAQICQKGRKALPV